MAESLSEQVVKYLTDAHAIEEQAIQQLEAAAWVAGARMSRGSTASTSRRPASTSVS